MSHNWAVEVQNLDHALGGSDHWPLAVCLRNGTLITCETFTVVGVYVRLEGSINITKGPAPSWSSSIRYMDVKLEDVSWVAEVDS